MKCNNLKVNIIIIFLLICNVIIGLSYRIQTSTLKYKLISNKSSLLLKSTNVLDLGDSDDNNTKSDKTDEELGKTHGYEGDFKVGDIVRIKESITIWSVKEYADKGFNCQGYEGVVQSLVLYGRKYKSLCSAITPVKVEFQPASKGIPDGMFSRKFSVHFASTELEKIK